SRAANSSVAMGRALANSAASSSFARGVTTYFHVRKRAPLGNPKLTQFGKLEEAKERRENLPRLGAAVDELRPENSRLEGQDRSNDDDRTGNVERARHDLVHLGLGHYSQHPIDSSQQFGERHGERRLRRCRRLR